MQVILLISTLECGCSLNNSKTQDCDASGSCTCEENYSGSKCTDCANGFFGYPECKGNLIISNIPKSRNP